MWQTSATATPPYHVGSRSRELADYHFDESRPGRPLYLLIPGALLALISLVGIACIGYSIWDLPVWSKSPLFPFLLALLAIYFGGLLLFFYGYELYDFPKALLYALVAGVAGIALIAVSIAAIYAIAALGRGGSKSSGGSGGSRSGSSGSSSSSSSHSSLNLGGVVSDLLDDGVIPLNLNAGSGPAHGPISGREEDHCPKCGQIIQALVTPVLSPGQELCPLCDQPLPMGLSASGSAS